MANEHPFQMLFESLGRLPVAHAESVNRQAYEVLYDILSVPLEQAGRCILLRAPRAGHGKTHLLSRIQHHLGASHEFIPLHATFGSQIDAASVIDDALRRLLRPLPASGGLCVLDLVARRLFASALQPLVASGEVPCQDREGALTALRTRPIETFDFHHPNAVTAHWARENFEILGQRLSLELAQRSGLPIREVAFWVDALFRFAATPVENPVRLRVLAEVVHAGSPGDGILMERLVALLGLVAQLMRVVLVADDLEGFSTDESAALRLAAFIGALRQSVDRLDFILSINQDIWQSAFIPRLSGGLVDRLSEVVVELKPLTENEMVALLESRVPGLGERVLSRVDRNSAGNHARGLIRAAGIAWLKASAMDSHHAVSPVAAATQSREAPSIGASEPVQLAVAQEPPPLIVPMEAAEMKIPEVEPVPAPVAPDPEPVLAVSDPIEPVFSAATPVEMPPPVMPSNPPIETRFQEVGSLEPQAFMPAGSPPVDSGYADFSSPIAAHEPVLENASADSFQTSHEFGPAPAFEAGDEPLSAPILEYSPLGFADTPAIPENHEFARMPDIQAAPDVAVARDFQAPTGPPAIPPEFQREPGDAQSTGENTDRVDDLLRQFRERYGRGSL